MFVSRTVVSHVIVFRAIVSRCLLAVSLLLVVPLAQAAPDSQAPTVEQLKQDTQALAEKLQHFTADQRDQAMTSIRSTLKALDQRIGELRQSLSDHWGRMSDKSRAESQRQLNELLAQRKRVQGWSERLKDSSASAWNSVKKGFSNAYRGLSEAWQNSEKILDKDAPASPQLQKSI